MHLIAKHHIHQFDCNNSNIELLNAINIPEELNNHPDFTSDSHMTDMFIFFPSHKYKFYK